MRRRSSSIRRASSKPASTCATHSASTSCPTSLPSTTSAGAKSPSPATGELHEAATSTRPARRAAAHSEPKPKRFAVSYHLLRAEPGASEARRVRVQVWLDDGEATPSVVRVWPTADWHEREAWDMMGIHFDGHPNLVRILMEDDWQTIRCARTTRSAASPSASPTRSDGDSSPRIYEGTRIPSPIPTVIEGPEELRREADILEVNFGPNHPSTHGVLRLVVQLDEARPWSA